MPRLSKAVPKYQLHRASGQAVVSLSGRDCYLGPHGTKVSKVAYDLLVAEWLQNGRQLVEGTDGGLTVVEVIALTFGSRRSTTAKGRCRRASMPGSSPPCAR